MGEGFAGGNIGLLVGDEGVMLIDDSYPPLTEKMLDAVATITDRPVDFLINTHVHGDHVGGNVILAGRGAHIVAHDNVRRRLAEEGLQTMPGEYSEAPKEMLPILTFADAVTLYLNGHETHVRHVPHAHTDGDAIIHFVDADVIHAGDLLFNGIFPFIDSGSGGTLDGFIVGQEWLLELAGPDTKIIAGHGPMGTRADIEASVAMLKDAREKISALVAEGKSLEEVQAAKPLAAHERWSWAFISTELMVEQVYGLVSPE